MIVPYRSLDVPCYPNYELCVLLIGYQSGLGV